MCIIVYAVALGWACFDKKYMKNCVLKFGEGLCIFVYTVALGWTWSMRTRKMLPSCWVWGRTQILLFWKSFCVCFDINILYVEIKNWKAEFGVWEEEFCVCFDKNI